MNIVRRVFTIFILLFFPVVAGAYSYPGAPMGYVNDFAGMLQADTVRELNTVLQDQANKTGEEIVVATVATIGSDTIEYYAVSLFEDWKIGKKGTDTGVLLLIVRDERAVRIEVGYGLEGTITDTQAHRIITDVLVPYFEKGEYDTGVILAVEEIQSYLGATDVDTQTQSDRDRIEIAIIIGIILLYIIIRIIGGPRIGTGIPIFLGSRSSGSSFRGFGGGRSGGGGASGKW